MCSFGLYAYGYDNFKTNKSGQSAINWLHDAE